MGSNTKEFKDPALTGSKIVLEYGGHKDSSESRAYTSSSMFNTDREQGLSTIKFTRHMLKGEDSVIKSLDENEST